MPTKTPTKPKSVEERLADRQRERDELHAVVLDARRQRDQWETDTELLRAEFTSRCHSYPEEVEGEALKPRPGTEAASLQAKIKRRVAEGNPHTSEYELALAPFSKADEDLQQFKVDVATKRIAEATSEHDDLAAEFREVKQREIEILNREQELVDRVRTIVGDTPRLARVGGLESHDPRLSELRSAAESALEIDLIRPGITPYGEHRLA